MSNDASNQLTTDVLVVGAGPIGLAVANLLADQGVNTIVVEKRSSTSDDPRAISATDETLRVMEEIGVLEKLAPEMLMDTGARYFGRNGQLLAEVKPAKPRLGQPGKNQFDQPVMESLLLEAAQNRSNVDVRFSTEAFRITESADNTVQTILIDDDGKKTVTSRWVLACDGGRSPLRTQLGIQLDGSTQVEKWIVVDLINSIIAPQPFSEFHCNGTRPFVVVPGVKGRRRYEFMVLPGETTEEVTAPEFIAKLVAPLEATTADDIRRAAVYVAHQKIAAQYRQGHVVLVGDAAHLMPPFAGQALNAGIRDAANIAWKLAANIKDGAPESLIDTYEQERRPHAADMVRLSHRIGQVVMSTDSRVTLLRDGAIKASGILPKAKKWITEMRFLKQPHYTEGCLVKPAAIIPAELADLVGRSLPQPAVRVGNSGTTTPLDQLLGRGWAILTFDANGTFRVRPLGGESLEVTDEGGAFNVVPGGYALIVRPDRYVAAAIVEDEVSRTLVQLSEFVPSLNQHA